MKPEVQKALEIWHDYFADEKNHYAEYEPSDIEYFVGCMLYNHFAFSKAHHNLKTMDLSYDFLQATAESYDRVAALIASIGFESEQEALAFLQEYIAMAQSKYTKAERYLLDRLAYHVSAMAERYAKGVDIEHIDFANPLLRK